MSDLELKLDAIMRLCTTLGCTPSWRRNLTPPLPGWSGPCGT